mmetsp:Transcript_126569/g.188885  ORF Transcript_126569/g.188885 Transcript_126569/m.188885 type:complete len:104 (+) Transcript_126569:102-413(+)
MMVASQTNTHNMAAIIQKRSSMKRQGQQGRDKKKTNRLLRHFNTSPLVLLFCGFLLLTLVNSSRITLISSPPLYYNDYADAAAGDGMTISIGGVPKFNRVMNP